MNQQQQFTHFYALAYSHTERANCKQASKRARVEHGKNHQCNPELRLKIKLKCVCVLGAPFFRFFQKQKWKSKRWWWRRKMMSVPFLKLSRRHCEIGIGPIAKKVYEWAHMCVCLVEIFIWIEIICGWGTRTEKARLQQEKHEMENH